MTLIDGQSALGADTPAFDALDASIDREVRRGRSQTTLPVKLRSILDVIVSHETLRAAPLNAVTLGTIAPVAGVLATFRHDRRVNALLRRGLLRRDKLTIRPTVAGIGAVHPTALDLARIPQDVLRELRRGEIGAL